MAICKQCREFTYNGTGFCSRKCRLKWRKEHNYTKKDWKNINLQNEKILMKMSGGVDMGNFGNRGRR